MMKDKNVKVGTLFEMSGSRDKKHLREFFFKLSNYKYLEIKLEKM